ncbi:restriction endonuclease subunit S, partial [Schnuerera sp.]|uniref:restriction endonuclease subunit S n=1 Tax=Schnuerera sp. TaxID=2794844 RepID=UPI002C09BF45
LQQERIAHLKEYKKGMMQRIFSQEIRFKDENGQDYPDWEEKKLGEVVKRKKGKVVEFTNNGEYPVIEIEYFNTGRIMNYTNTDNGVWCEEKDVLLLWDGSQSGNIFTNISGIVGSTIMRLRPINVNNVFLTLALKHDKLYIKSIREGSGIPHIPKDFLTHYVVNLPSLPEQQKIANFLSSIDKKIELEEEKLTKLKELKKGLMQRMFV